MGIVAWIVLGLMAGFIAKLLLGSRAQHGIIITILIGITGALLGGWVASKYFGVNANKGFFDVSTWLTAIAGSAVLLLIYQAITSGTFKTSRRRARR